MEGKPEVIGLNGDMETMTNSKSHVNKWKSGAVPTKIGRRTIHPSFETEHIETHDLFRCTFATLLFMCRNPRPLQYDGP
uniref:Uncharacterized protein n=2 Tax=Brassica TaxID=3705 RepID=M4F926_BRACM